MTPASTYRLQLHGGFGFADAAAITDYLHALGVDAVYTSPYLRGSSILIAASSFTSKNRR